MKKRKVLTKIDGNCLSKITRSIGTDPKVLGGRGLVLGSVRGSKTPRTSNLSDGLTKGQWIENNSQCGEKKRFPEEREGKANEFSASRNGTLSFRNRCNQLQYDQVKENNNFKIIGDTEARKGQWKPTLRNERGTMQTLPSAKGYFDQNIGSESDFRIARYVEKDKLSSHEVQHDYFKSSARQGDVHGRLDGHRSFRRSLNATIPSNCTIGSKLPGQFESTEESELAVSSPCRIRSAKWNLQGREYEPQYKSNANSTQPSHGGYFTKSSKSTASIDSKEIEAQNTDYQLQVWSVEGNPSSPLHLKIDGKIYLHPQLPSGWEIIVSETQKRPFYVHPDFGSTWHCPIILPRKVLKKNQGDVDVVMEKDAISADHTTTKRKQRNVVNRAPIQKKRLEKSMSELVTSYESEKRYPDDTPIDDLKRQIITGGYGISQTMDVEDSSSAMESSWTEPFCSPHLTPRTFTGPRSTDTASKFLKVAPKCVDSVCVMTRDKNANNDTFDFELQQQSQNVQTRSTLEMKYMERSEEGSLFSAIQMALDSSSRLERDKDGINLSPYFQDSRQSASFGGDSNMQAIEKKDEAVKNNRNTAEAFIKCKASGRYPGTKCISDPSTVSDRDYLPVGSTSEVNLRCTQRSVFSCTEKVDTYLPEDRGSIFRHAYVVDTPNYSNVLSKTRTASTESSSMSESSSRRENDQFSDRKTAQLMTPDKKSAVAPTCNSVMERCSDSHSWIFHRDHRKQQQTSPAEEPNALAICERLQIETREEVWNIGTPPSTPPRIQVASETQVSNAVDSRSMMEFRDSVRGRHLLQKAELGVAINRRKYSSTNACGKSTASESDESKKNDDELLTSQCRVGSAERDSTSFSKSTSPNAAAPPSTQSQRFSADFTGSQGNTEEQPSSCPRTPVSTANDDCDEAEKSITSNHSGDPPAATYGLDSVSTQSNSLEADFSLSSGSADEGMVSPSISLHFSPYAGGVNTGKPLCEALVHLSCDSSRKESSSTLQSKTNMIRRGAGRRSMSRRWEVWNHPLCSLQRLNNLSK